MSEIENGFFQSGGYDLSYKIHKNGKNRALLLFHGFQDASDTFLYQFPFLCEHFDVFRFDYRGHGDSEWLREGSYNFIQTLADVKTFVSRFLPDRFHILGHSMGGGIGARFAGIYPEKILSLVCLEGFMSLPSLENERKRLKVWLDTLENNVVGTKDRKNKTFRNFDEIVSRLKPVYPRLAAGKIEDLARYLTKETDSGFQWKNDPLYKRGFPFVFSPHLSRHLWECIESPTMIVYGKETHLMPENRDEILSHFKYLEYFEIENAGHNMHHDQPESLVRLLNEFYRKHGFIS
ncbi:alpha/beta hydrolase [Leptospira gomenensis]|uniref:Alpha/beta hydrolase n=1 Tax=Leptospira gomenensis TaxID=2484974 RepID=A0A5F1YF08_9LEPT|nr:alpha/beta hydrolase [Leptospira gomenensis]TGK37450.1 alpha/beta hydrolase [Leptospira gomenensis]TGK40809.1 alpha/beta hydrolase [Leptospira gomenensis]TGK43035.1 alpha/beta hydrolase [Leptospira gomenensis]TGK54299.1 alpha/beta hydrolase [Leptospira gomenensis]